MVALSIDIKLNNYHTCLLEKNACFVFKQFYQLLCSVYKNVFVVVTLSVPYHDIISCFFSFLTLTNFKFEHLHDECCLRL